MNGLSGSDGGHGPSPEERERFSRRAALKRGAIVGGSLLWVTPVVQSLAMSPGLAQSTSPVGNTTTTEDRSPTTTERSTTTTSTTAPEGTTTTTAPGGTTTTTTTAPGGTTTTTAPGGTTTTTAPANVLGTGAERTGGSPSGPTGPGAQVRPQVLASEASRAPAAATRGAGLASTGAELANLAAIGGASTIVGAAAVSWAGRRRAAREGSAEPDEAVEVERTDAS